MKSLEAALSGWLLSVALVASSQSFASDGKEREFDPFESFNGKTIPVYETMTVGEGTVFDGKGNLYHWMGEGDCSQTEGMPPMFVLLPGSTLKNLWMKGAPDGVHVKGSNITIDRMVNVDVCEDAISISKTEDGAAGENVEISNSRFFYCHDKAIQLTRGNNVLVRNSEFHDCAKAVRIKEAARNIRFEDNKVFGASSAIKLTGGEGYAAGNLITGSEIGFWAEQQGSLAIGPGNVFVDVLEEYRETEEGTIRIVEDQ